MVLIKNILLLLNLIFVWGATLALGNGLEEEKERVEIGIVSPTDATSLYGLRPMIKDAYYTALSPALAESYLSTGFIKRLYRMKPFEERETGKTKKKRKDSSPAEDPVLELVHLLFFMIPGDDDSLLVPKKSEFLGSHLTPATVGELMQALLVDKSTDKNALGEIIKKRIIFTQAQKDEIVSNLPLGVRLTSDELHSDPPIQGLIALQSRLSKMVDPQKKGKLGLNVIFQSNPECNHPGGLDSEIEALAAQSEEAVQQLQRETILDAIRILAPVAGYKKPKAEQFVTVLLDAIEYCKKPDSPYPPEFPFQLLQAQLLLKAKDYRKALLEEWAHSPGVMAAGALDRMVSEEFLKHRMSHEEFLHEMNASKRSVSPINGHILSGFPATSPENAVASLQYLKANVHGSDRPPLFNQFSRDIVFKRNSGGPELTSSDCCEASFLNFFIFFLNDLKSNPKIKIKPALADFLATHPLDPGNASTRKAWKALSSEVPGLRYRVPGLHDLNPDIDNLSGLIGYFIEFPPEVNLSKVPRKNRLKEICFHVGCRVVVEGAAPDSDASKPWNKGVVTFVKEKNRKLAIDIGDRHCHAHYDDFSLEETDRSDLYMAFENKILHEPDEVMKKDHGAYIEILARKYAEDCNMGELSRFAQLVNYPKMKKHILPVLLGCPLSSPSRIWNVIQVILENKFQLHYPLALSMLKGLSWDEFSLKKLSKLPVFETPERLRPEVGEIVAGIEKSLSGMKVKPKDTTLIAFSKEWIRGMRKLNHINSD